MNIQNQNTITAVQQTAENLRAAGVTQNDRIAILSENSPAMAITILALWQTKAIAAPISTRYTPAQIKSTLTQTNCKTLITQTPNDYPNAIPIEKIIPNPPAEIADTTFKDLNLDLSTDATIISTSSTTGPAKSVLHTLSNHYHSAAGSDENIPFGPDHTWLLTLPIYHISGLSVLTRALYKAGKITFPDQNETLTETIKTKNFTHISLVHTQLKTLLSDPACTEKLKNCKAILLGGSAIPGELIKSALANNLPIQTTYGSSETASQLTTTAANDLQNNQTSSGRLLPYREIIIAPDGEILTKGKTLFKGYVTENSIDLPLDAEGYFHTNDTGRLENNQLFVTARKDRMFISGGENIHPEQIESELLKIKGITVAKVTSAPDKKFGQVPIAHIQTEQNSPINPQQIIKQLQNKLEPFKIPKQYHPLDEQ